MKQYIKYILSAILLIFVTYFVFARYARDTIWSVPETFRNSDPVGTWLVQTSELAETVALRGDGTFTQIFTSTVILGPKPIIQHGTWSIEHRESGCIYVRLDNMLYLHGTMDSIRSASPGAYTTLWDDCEERLISVENRMILVVAFFDEMALMLPSVDREGSAMAKLERIAPFIGLTP